jgi:hypothetical protein
VLLYHCYLGGRCSCAHSYPLYPARPELRGDRSPRRAAPFSSIPFSPHHFLYSFRPSFNCPGFLHFPNCTDSRTDPSSLYPLPPLSLTAPYRKTGGAGRGGPLFSPLATRHSPLPLSPIIPALTVHSPVTPIIPALTRTPRGEGSPTKPNPQVIL